MNPRTGPRKKMGSSTAELPILLAVVGFGVILAGGLLSSYHPQYTPPSIVTASGICCDSGNGASCHPLVDASHPVLTYNSPTAGAVQYGLLKSGVTMTNPCHIVKTNQTYEGNPIIINSSEKLQGECGGGKLDQLDAGNCVAIPDDEIIYVCKSNCYDTPASFRPKVQVCNEADPNFVTYGDNTTVFDAYFRLSDYPNPGIPAPIKNCEPYISGTPLAKSLVTSPSIVFQPYAEHKSLQLHTLGFDQASSSATSISSFEPYCKPAIYLYPEQPESISVKIAPKGDIKLTIPQYPATGWNVFAKPNGDISYQQQQYDYLFYEAKIPDTLLSSEQKGFVIAYTDLSQFFKTMLPKLNLNYKEQTQFSDYWLKALPKNPYYLISIMPTSTLDSISPLTIFPTPNTVIRVTLSFEPLDKKIAVQPPVIPTIQRTGFTVVEWGGLFKKDKNHPFTCLM